MKALKIFLLFLVVSGIILLYTERFWVPKTVPAPQASLSLKDGRQCYTYNHEATADAPYTVNEFIDIIIDATKVTGTKTGTQSGPDMTNGYTGTFIGTLNKDTITDVFSYVVEGSHNKEKEIYRANQTGIEKLRYPLIEENKMLVPDTTKQYALLLYPRVGCTASN